MAQINSILNVFVISLVLVTAVFWVGSPAPAKPLPDDPHFVAQINQPGAVLVKFGADWCGPCRNTDQELDVLAKTHSGDVSIVKIDVDKNPALASHYQISGIPSMILFRNGKQVGSTRGYHSCEQLKSWIASKR